MRVKPSTNALLAELDNVGRLFLSYERGAGVYLVDGCHSILGVVSQEDYRQIPLQELLLVDREQHIAVAHGVEHLRTQIEGGEGKVLAASLERLQCRQSALRT